MDCDWVIFANGRVFGRDPDRIVGFALDGISPFHGRCNHLRTLTKPKTANFAGIGQTPQRVAGACPNIQVKGGFWTWPGS